MDKKHRWLVDRSGARRIDQIIDIEYHQWGEDLVEVYTTYANGKSQVRIFTRDRDTGEWRGNEPEIVVATAEEMVTRFHPRRRDDSE